MQLNVENLSFSFGGRVLFAQLNFSMRPGELIYLRGQNGCGKTTLLKLLSNNLSGYHGSIRNTFAASEYLPAENNGLFMHLSAVENLQFWQSFSEEKNPTAIRSALDRWNLKDSYMTEKLPVQKFSTGMKRRLALSRLILSDAPLLLLDEPCNGLDEAGVALFRAWLQQSLVQRKAVILVSHDKSVVEGLNPSTIELVRS